VADIVIEFFACDIPPGYIAAMAQRPERPVWLNLEGLSAEEWVEGCHGLPSKHPRLPLTKYFFFPGFTEKTGGLLYEKDLEAERRAYISDPAAVSAFWSSLGVTEAEAAAMKVSLFCYPYAPVAQLFAAWRDGGRQVTCLVPEGVATEAVANFLGQPAVPGAVRSEGALTVRVLPFVPQQDYDKLLWSCELNFVRGEDSWRNGLANPSSGTFTRKMKTCTIRSCALSCSAIRQAVRSTSSRCAGTARRKATGRRCGKPSPRQCLKFRQSRRNGNKKSWPTAIWPRI
jgi:uncharacterized repeat protein (TIGR03837 family)